MTVRSNGGADMTRDYMRAIERHLLRGYTGRFVVHCRDGTIQRVAIEADVTLGEQTLLTEGERSP